MIFGGDPWRLDIASSKDQLYRLPLSAAAFSFARTSMKWSDSLRSTGWSIPLLSLESVEIYTQSYSYAHAMGPVLGQ